MIDLELKLCETCKFAQPDKPQTYSEKRVYGRKNVLRCNSSDSKYWNKIVQPKEHCNYHEWSGED